jgi:ribonuclease I
MFDNYINKTKATFLDRVTLTDDRITLKELVSNEQITQGFRDFFEAELNWWVYSEISKFVSSKHFDYLSSGIITENFDDQLRSSAFVDRKDFEKLVDYAVKARLNFLLRPQLTLEQYIMGEEQSTSPDEALMKLNYFSDYLYFKTGLKAIFDDLNNNDIYKISREDLKAKITEIDYENIGDMGSDEFIGLLEPVFDYFNTNVENKNEQVIPTEALMIFFDDKGMTPLVKILDKKYNELGQKLVSRQELYDFINEMISSSDLESDQELGEENTVETDLIQSFEDKEELDDEDIEALFAANNSDVNQEDNSVETDLIQSFEDKEELDDEDIEALFAANNSDANQEDNSVKTDLIQTFEDKEELDDEDIEALFAANNSDANQEEKSVETNLIQSFEDKEELDDEDIEALFAANNSDVNQEDNSVETDLIQSFEDKEEFNNEFTELASFLNNQNSQTIEKNEENSHDFDNLLNDIIYKSDIDNSTSLSNSINENIELGDEIDNIEKLLNE